MACKATIYFEACHHLACTLGEVRTVANDYRKWVEEVVYHSVVMGGGAAQDQDKVYTTLCNMDGKPENVRTLVDPVGDSG